MRIRNVLVFPAGTEIGLEIYNALKYCKEIALFGAGQNISNHARFAYTEYHVLPAISELGWLDSLIKLVQQLNVDYIFPAYDDVIVALSRVADRIPAVVISSSARTCEITRSKSHTYRVLAGKVRVPHLYASPEEVDKYPVLLKPDRGQGTQGVILIENLTDLHKAIQSVQDPIICEYLPGDEFTVDCFTDREHGLLFASARRRHRIRNGISVNTEIVKLPEARTIAEIIENVLQLRGAWFYQLKRSADGELVLLEVAPRIAGAMATHRVSGINFPLLSIFEHERLPLNLLINPGKIELDRALCNRYRHEIRFRVVYIDLDDTLILKGHVNLLVIKFIFQCINQNKIIKLLTRHKSCLEETLRKHRLSQLFDGIIPIPDEVSKADLIKESDAIFVDDSFAERMEVFQRCGIRTFDCSMLEILTEQSESISEV